MKSTIKKSMLILVLLTTFSLTAQASPSPTDRFLVRVTLSTQPKVMKQQMQQIHALDLDFAGVNLKTKQMDLIVTPTEQRMLLAHGFQSLTVEDFSTKKGPDSQYFTSAKVESTLKAYASTYPDLTHVQSVGKSLEGRDIWAIQITNHKTSGMKPKPTILFNGMHHAREVMSVEVPMDIIQTLLTQYGKDAQVTHWVDANEIWVLPMLNVDGNNIVWTSDKMWRKNSHGGYGVDINRNYPYAWNSCNGSSSSTGAQDYHGPNAASEPETQVMMNFVKTIRPVFDISFHSYSELVIYPYGCPGAHTPNHEIVEGIGAEVAASIASDDGKGHYTPGIAPDLLYPVDGGDIDWMYHEYQVIPYVIEVNSTSQGFQPSYAKWRNRTVANVRPGWQVLMKKLDGASVRGKTTPGAKISIERVGTDAHFVQETTSNANGFYDVIVTPGQYTVSVNEFGLSPLTKTVTVGNLPVEILK